MKILESIKLSSPVQKPRHGSKINWVFNSGLKFSVSAGVLGAVGVILVIKAKRFINFTPPDQDGASSRFWAVPGLQNLGNNCFLNVVLQALASCSSFRKYLGEMLQEYGSSAVEGDEHIPLRPGCTLEDCLKKFFVAELVENYCCSNCWHTAAIDYLSGLAEDKTDIEKLRRCNKNDSCECKTLSSLEAFPWSNRFSRTFKQLSIARSPKILCIHLQRASFNMFGQSVKLLGHVSFPLMLDVSSFMNTGVGLKNMEANSRSGLWSHSSRELRAFPYSMYQNMLLAPGMPSSKIDRVESISSASEIVEKQERNAILVGNGPCPTASESGPSLLGSTRHADKHANFPSPPQRHQTYRLVSVVVHFGSSGGGHYTVYRKVTARIGDEDPVALLESTIEQWFCISDSEVHTVSEKDVLDANASMLFYEKIN
ncbi:UNVERIFIED_CONTAM: Ubiquitin carboxyl-terminal hydrolase 27 [Sesamum radiatum]|uniref:Ubiquitin carboxyl-terminal hydrolase n=1 Tax=Sesamum radiatum TaxID=300843 RepID=A0AAW2RFA2_SESRA